VLEFSERQLRESTVSISVEGDDLLAGPKCTVSSKHSRSYITPYGPMVPQAGAWWGCRRGWATKGGPRELERAFEASVQRNKDVRACRREMCEGLYSPSQKGSIVFDAECPIVGAAGCNIGGKACCRYCGVHPYMACNDRHTQTAP